VSHAAACKELITDWIAESVGSASSELVNGYLMPEWKLPVTAACTNIERPMRNTGDRIESVELADLKEISPFLSDIQHKRIESSHRDATFRQSESSSVNDVTRNWWRNFIAK
jgi:hypothetical protein